VSILQDVEFGVHLGFSVNISADWRARNCPSDVPTFFGFDTFTGAHPLHGVHSVYSKMRRRCAYHDRSEPLHAGLPEDWSGYAAVCTWHQALVERPHDAAS